MRKRLVLALLVIAPACCAALAVAWRPVRVQVAEPIVAKAAAHVPSLFCEFYDFMHKTVVASFDFGVDARNPTILTLRAQAFPDGTETVHDEGERPRWSFAFEDGLPTAIAPDSETRIILYGLKPDRGGVAWSEAGVRSSSTRNLEGRCRQAYLDQARLDVGAIGNGQEETRR